MSTKDENQSDGSQALQIRWYCLSANGMATLALDKADAEKVAAESDQLYPRNGPHVAVQMVPVQPDGRGTDAQIEKERDIARHAIVGAIAAGHAGQAHPGADHWLAAAHDAGARIAELEQSAGRPRAPCLSQIEECDRQQGLSIEDAWQALEALTALLPNKSDPNHEGHDARDVRKWRALVERLRALTQRPAAHTEREAFEPNAKLMELADRIDHEQLWRLSGLAQMDLPQEKQDRVLAGVMLRRYAELLGNDGWRIFPPRPGVSFRASTLDKVVEMARRDDARRASLPAPQQATPERHLTVTTNQQGEAFMVSWQDDEHRILEVVWERNPATPEPVGEVVYIAKGHLREVLNGNTMNAYLSPEPDRFADVALSTRPAPGVPEGFTSAPPTEQGWYWHWNGDEDSRPIPTSVLWSGSTGTCFVSRGQLGLSEAIDCDKYGGYWLKLNEPWDALAAAQAKGGQA